MRCAGKTASPTRQGTSRHTAPPAEAGTTNQGFVGGTLLWLAFATLCGVLALTSCSESTSTGTQDDAFIRLMNTGKNYLDQNQADKAIPLFTQAVALAPSRTDAHLNLANAFLVAGQAENALRHAQEVLNYDRNSAAAYYVAGCAHPASAPVRSRRFRCSSRRGTLIPRSPR